MSFTVLACGLVLACLAAIVATLAWLWRKDWPPGQRTAPGPEERT